MADKVQPWQRQPGEPALWYNRFKAYLDMGKDRSINGVYALLRDGAEQGRINMAKAPATFYRMPDAGIGNHAPPPSMTGMTSKRQIQNESAKPKKPPPKAQPASRPRTYAARLSTN